MKKRLHQRPENIQAVDLFCGAGGLTCGLKKVGIKVQAGFDIDSACKYAYEFNNKAPFVQKDITDLPSEAVASFFSSNAIRLVAGCAPCQTFSTYNQKASRSDSRWWLLGEFTRIVKEIGPEFVTMENVPGLEGHSVFSRFIKTLKTFGYQVSSNIVECCNYGIPQSRQRLVVLASRLGEIRLLSPEEFGAGRVSVKEAIGKLPKIGAGAVHESDPLHQTADLSPLNMKRMRASKPGGTWRDWKPELIAECHKKKSGKTYPSVYGRMEWEEPSPTITTQFFGFGNGRFGHPEQDRAISLREGAILQSFPGDYQFTAPGEPIFKTVIGRLIGNAVPVTLGEVIGKSFIEHLKSLNKSAQRNP